MRLIKLGEPRANGIHYRDVTIPAPYDRIVSQLLAELQYSAGQHAAEVDVLESRRRQFYARKTLYAFIKELKELGEGDAPSANFRSKVLTPILQRQLQGVPDSYTPTVRTSISAEADGEPTITDVTKFYLNDDPVDPGFIPTYRRSLLHISEARWHLSIVAGVAEMAPTPDAKHHYAKVRRNHDAIMAAISAEGFDGFDELGVPLLKSVEVKAIFDEGLQDFFEDELKHVVRDVPPTSTFIPLMSPTACAGRQREDGAGTYHARSSRCEPGP